MPKEVKDKALQELKKLSHVGAVPQLPRLAAGRAVEEALEEDPEIYSR